MFDFQQSMFNTVVRNNIHYLFADSDMFGDCKFGDLAMYSTYLHYLKRFIIFYWPKYNQDNLFFIFNKRSEMKIDNLHGILSLFSNVWKGIDSIEGGKFNIRQLVKAGNLWAFKTYLDNNDIYLTDNDRPIIDPFGMCISHNKRNAVYVLPVMNKRYNVERNMSIETVVNIIRHAPTMSKVFLITKDSGADYKEIRSRSNRNLTELGDDMSWTDILIQIMSNCKLFISGDCGLSHFVSVIDKKYKPEMIIYYNTLPLKMDKRFNEFDREVNEVNFTPLRTYKDSKLTIINNI
jgi:hypothetical protein